MLARKILVMGLPNSGKTTFAKALAGKIGAVLWDADAVRDNLWPDLGFSETSRIMQARRMGILCDTVIAAGGTAIASFVCPTPACRDAFGKCFTIWMDTGRPCPYADTAEMFVPPSPVDLTIKVLCREERDQAAYILGGAATEPTALLVGRWQPFHEGHQRLVEYALARYPRVCIGIRSMPESQDNPWSQAYIRKLIEVRLSHLMDRISIIVLPNISGIVYGRDVGYKIEKAKFPGYIEEISGTKIREELRNARKLEAGSPSWQRRVADFVFGQRRSGPHIGPDK